MADVRGKGPHCLGTLPVGPVWDSVLAHVAMLACPRLPAPFTCPSPSPFCFWASLFPALSSGGGLQVILVSPILTAQMLVPTPSPSALGAPGVQAATRPCPLGCFWWPFPRCLLLTLSLLTASSLIQLGPRFSLSCTPRPRPFSQSIFLPRLVPYLAPPSLSPSSQSPLLNTYRIYQGA